MIIENIQGVKAYDVWLPAVRLKGLSAMVRLKDEAEYVIPSLDSIVEWCDEVIVCLQGEQTDGTDRLVAEWVSKYDKAQLYEYPYDSLPNGPGHASQPKDSLYERAYFYNWCLSFTNYRHVIKWDGDMVAQTWLGELLRERLEHHDSIRMAGTDIGASGLPARYFKENKPRAFKVGPDTRYYSGESSEQLQAPDGILLCEMAAFGHYKWLKSEQSITKAWPENWRDIPHFRELISRRIDARP